MVRSGQVNLKAAKAEAETEALREEAEAKATTVEKKTDTNAKMQVGLTNLSRKKLK